MALSASLFLRQNQSLVMTPQLMQSIQLLQMTHLELNQFIAQEVEKNPLLEILPAEADSGVDVTGDETGGPPQQEHPAFGGSPSEDTHDWYEAEPLAAAGRLQEFDTSLENVFPDDGIERKADAPELIGQWKSMPGADAGEGYDLDDFVAGTTSLRDHLGQQVPFLFKDAADRLIAQHIIDHVDDAGYFSGDIAEIAKRLGKEADEVKMILGKLQSLDPPGVLARSLSECLAIQLQQRDRLDPAMAALLQHLDLLARRDFAALRKICGVGDEDLIDMLAEIRMLDPKPGSGFGQAHCETITPDVLVRPISGGGWDVEVNPDTLPRVLVDRSYFNSVSNSRSGQREDLSFLSECLQSANWLTRSLDQRTKTILKVATEIVRQQDAFLLYGVDHLRPLNLRTVADAIKMHESTVSRVTSNKYMLTPRGLFELKYFFTVSIGSAEEGGDSHSAEAVRHRIRALISQETAAEVLSDDDIVISLKKGGVELARRTVAKYRESMNIPSSVQRRREKRAMAKLTAL